MRIDGHRVQEYPLKPLRDSIAMVLQKNTLFSGTVIDNLRWGKEDASKEEIEEGLPDCLCGRIHRPAGNGYETDLARVA